MHTRHWRPPLKSARQQEQTRYTACIHPQVLHTALSQAFTCNRVTARYTTAKDHRTTQRGQQHTYATLTTATPRRKNKTKGKGMKQPRKQRISAQNMSCAFKFNITGTQLLRTLSSHLYGQQKRPTEPGCNSQTFSLTITCTVTTTITVTDRSHSQLQRHDSHRTSLRFTGSRIDTNFHGHGTARTARI